LEGDIPSSVDVLASPVGTVDDVLDVAVKGGTGSIDLTTSTSSEN